MQHHRKVGNVFESTFIAFLWDYSLSLKEQYQINTIWRGKRSVHNLFNANAQSEQVTIKRVDLAFKGFFAALSLAKVNQDFHA